MTPIGRLALMGVIGAALLGSLAGPATAQIVQIDELQPLRPDATVQIEVVAHSVVVEGWDRNEIRIVGEYDSDIDVLVQSGGSEESFRFELNQDDRRRHGRPDGSSRLEVSVPRGVSLSVETVSGSLDVSGLSGALTASAVSGGVDVTGDLASASLSSVSGPVDYAGDAPTVRLESVSGGVEYLGTARDVRLESVSGSVFAEGGAETIEAESVSGTIRIRSDVPILFLDASSVSGGVRFSGALAPAARVDVESHSGTVELTLGSGTDAEFELESFSGRVSANLTGMQDEVRYRRRRGPPNQLLRFVTGSGSGRVRASSFSGSVRIEER